MNETIYKVSFRRPPLTGDERTEFFFGSLKAIYSILTEEHIGCKVETLWANHITEEHPFHNAHCTITCNRVYRKRQDNPSRGRK